MIDLFELSEFWLIRALLTGGLVLLIGRLAMMLVRQPARRAIFGIAAVVASLLVIPLSCIPGWWKVSVPVEESPSRHAVNPATPEPNRQAANSVAALPQWYFVFWKAEDAALPNIPSAVPASSLPDLETQHATTVPVPTDPPEVTARDFGFWMLLAIAYGLISFWLLARLIVGHLALRKLWQSSHPPPIWALKAFNQLADPACNRAQLRVASGVVGPVCFGVLRPRVLIPVSMLADGDRTDFRCVLAHELGHLSRWDPLAGWFLGLARVVYFIWPWLSGVRREVRLAQEYLADAEAARLASAPTEYAELLIRMVRSRPVPLGAAGVRGTNSELYWRVIMLLQQPVKIERHCPRRWQIAMLGGLVSFAILAAGLSFQPRTVEAAEPEKKDPAKPEPKPAPKPAPKTDVLKGAIDKIKKDVGDDPDALKQLEDLLKTLQKEQPGVAVAPPLPPVMPFQPLPFDGDFQKIQEQMLKQLEAMMPRLQAGNVRGGFLLGPGGMPPFPGMGGTGRLGVRVERPSDALASQLDLPNGKGLVISDVPAESTAGKIGIKPHDILLEVAGKPVSSQVQEFVRSLKEVKEDAAIDIIVMRKGKKETLKAVKLPAAKDVMDPFLPIFPEGGFPAIPLLPGGPNALPVPQVLGPGETVRVEQVNDAFTVFYVKQGIKVTLTGSKNADGQPKAESIEVDEDGKVSKAESIEKLPKEYQDLARTALKSIK